MTSSNRVRLTGVLEDTYGTTPDTPRMRKQRVTSIGLSKKPETVESDDIRDDRMSSDPVNVGQTNTGQIGIEWHYPVPGSLLDAEIVSAFCNAWVNTPSRDNDGTADSVITGVTASTQVVAVATGDAFVTGQLVYFVGFGQSANRNKVAKCTTGSATAPAFLGAGLVDEATPPGTARMKVIGFQGASGDIVAAADGLTSTALDFTTLNLRIGQWVKIGDDTLSGCRFAGLPANIWGRIVGIAANKLTLDNLPATLATDTGTGKTISVFHGDMIWNSVSVYGVTLERGFMGQTTPTYIAQSGMRVNTMEFGGGAKQKATGSVSFTGMLGSSGTVSIDATPDDAPDNALYPVLAFSANCGRVGEAGVAIGRPNWVKNVKFTINNNLRAIDAVSNGDDYAAAPVDVQDGNFDVAVDLDTYFGSAALLAKIDAGTPTAVNIRLDKNNRAVIWEAPRVIPREGDPNVQGKNQDVMLPVKLTGSKDSLTGAQLILNRFEFFR